MREKSEEYYLELIPFPDAPASLEERRRLLRLYIFSILADSDINNARILLSLRKNQQALPTAKDFWAFLIKRVSDARFINRLFAIAERQKRHKQTGRLLAQRRRLQKSHADRRMAAPQVNARTQRRKEWRTTIPEENRPELERDLRELEENDRKIRAECLRLLSYFTPDT